MKTAVIDIGTNSVKLTVADVSDDIHIVDEESRITRLGKNVDANGKLNPESIKETLGAIIEFADKARSGGAQRIVAAGTSALRDASNGHELLDEVKKQRGLEVEIISGEREASLSFKAVVGDPIIGQKSADNLLVFDIGGGSTELNLGSFGKLAAHVSLNIGAVRLTERHLHADPPTDQEFDAALSDARKSINSFVGNIVGKPLVCGVGGTASTIAAMALSSKDVHGKSVSLTQVEDRVCYLRTLSLAERKNVQFLDPGRADIIIAGGAILISILKEVKVDAFIVSLRGMRYGLLLEHKTS